MVTKRPPDLLTVYKYTILSLECENELLRKRIKELEGMALCHDHTISPEIPRIPSLIATEEDRL